MSHSLISVIIPVYNVKYYLRKCLDSVLNQTYENLEIIIINDGSTDESAEICEEYANKDKRVTFISKKNEGQGTTRNLGVKVATGDYFTFLDSDDWLDLTYIEKMYNGAIRSKSDIVTCDIIYAYQQSNNDITETVSSLRVNPCTPIDPFTEKTLINRARTFLWGKLFKTEFYRSLHLFQPSHPYEDICITPLLIAKAKTVFHVPEPLIYYFRNRSNNTVDNLSLLSYMLESLNELVKKFHAYNLFESYYQEVEMLAYSQVRVALKKSELYTDVEKAQSFKMMLYDFMDKNFHGWINYFEFKCFVIGSQTLNAAISNLLVNEENIINCPNMSTVDRQNIIADYIFVDTSDDAWMTVLSNTAVKKIVVVDVEGKLNKHDLSNWPINVQCITVNRETDRAADLPWEISDEIFYSLH